MKYSLIEQSTETKYTSHFINTLSEYKELFGTLLDVHINYNFVNYLLNKVDCNVKSHVLLVS